MRIYKISEEKGKVERDATVRRTVYLTSGILLISVLYVVLSEARKGPLNLPFLMVSALFVAFVVLLSARRVNKLVDDAYASFALTVDGDSIHKVQKNTPDVVLRRSEIERIEELQGKGFKICTGERLRMIWVPCELEDYEQLKSELMSGGAIALVGKTHAWGKTYAGLAAYLALFFTQLVSSNRFVIAPAALGSSGYLFFALFRNYRNPNLTARGRRSMFWAALVGVAMLIRAVVIWFS
ncbi:MAG TPA: hypothetical protein VKZ53_26690 [Candidatus Angelobacter sp.]|nr:hypothetical protein [Candidatus Angelobacter sp.]